MSKMFSGYQSLYNLDLINFDTKNVTNMSWMFNGCEFEYDKIKYKDVQIIFNFLIYYFLFKKFKIYL